MLDPALLVAAANTRLRESSFSVQIEIRGRRLHLRATLPDRKTGRRRQQRIALGVGAVPMRVPEAEAAAARLGQQLLADSFRWADWTGQPPESDATPLPSRSEVEAWLYARLVERTPDPDRRAKSWRSWGSWAIRHLPDGPISGEVMLAALEALPYGSCKRQKISFAYCLIARHWGWDEAPLRAAGAGYSLRSVQPRDIPSDAAIVAGWHDMWRNTSYQWIFGVCATYGLRPSETMDVEFDSESNAIVAETGKTGSRLVWPCPADWVQKFKLLEKPGIGATNRLRISDYVSRFQLQHDVNIKLYTLRHAYAVRLLKLGVPSDIGARLLGHSPAIHHSTYRRWTSAAQMKALKQQWMPAPPEDG